MIGHTGRMEMKLKVIILEEVKMKTFQRKEQNFLELTFKFDNQLIFLTILTFTFIKDFEVLTFAFKKF